MGSASGLGTRDAGVHALRPGRRRVHGQAGRAARRPRRRAAGRGRRRPDHGALPPAPPRAGRPGRAGPGAPGVLRLGHHRGRGGGADRRHRRAAAGGQGRPGRPLLGDRVQGRAGPGRGEDRLRPHVLGHAAGAGPGPLRRRQARARSPRSRCSTGARPTGGPRSPPGGSAKLWGLGDVRIGDTIGGSPAGLGAALVRPADPGDGRRAPPAGRQGRPARRPDPAGRAGPADQPAPGRHPPGAVRLALRRGAEGGHPGHPGRRLRPRGRRSARPPPSASSGRSAPARRSSSSARSRTRSWPPSGCGSTRRRSAAG